MEDEKLAAMYRDLRFALNMEIIFHKRQQKKDKMEARRRLNKNSKLVEAASKVLARGADPVAILGAEVLRLRKLEVRT